MVGGLIDSSSLLLSSCSESRNFLESHSASVYANVLYYIFNTATTTTVDVNEKRIKSQ